ncbi:MAG TPA: glycosyltransferase family 2 protein [Candidatus Sulfotelmatobacter sp.]|nr:glycosyltransferase family 2 protein [Candidatus Sulfotelmatobacter sp.]
MTEISIIIVTWNGKRYAEECLDSLRAYINDPRAEVIVVDNASTDGTPEMIEHSYPGVTLIRNEKNLGFAKANNVGIQWSAGEYVLLVNSDVVVRDGCIERLVEYMKQNPRVGLLGPKMLGADGKAYRSYMAELTLWRCFCRAVAFDDLFPNSKFLGGYLMPYFKMDRVTEVDVLNGWFWVTRREALNEVGLMDDTLFMYGDDLDWSKRFRQAGWKLIYFPGAESLHYGGASSARAPIKFSVEMQRANFQYWQKHHGLASQIVYRGIVWMHQAFRLAGYSLLWLAAKSRQAETGFKAKRSLACMRWAMGIEDKRGEQVR